VLALDLVPGELEQPGDRVAVGTVPRRADRERPGGVRGDELDLDPLRGLGGTCGVVLAGFEDLVERLAADVDNRRCVVLASGDPCFFGIGPRLVERLGRQRVEIVPQVSSVALAFARLGLAWQDATVLSAHGRPLQDLLGPAMRADKLAILTDDQNTPAAIAEALLASGLAEMGLEVAPVETNIVVFRVRDAVALCAALERAGVLMGPLDATSVRAVTHLDVDRAGVERALGAVRAAV
jgi:precorrin-6y C5,15-methyltransferase (decarboxylating) CbiE subunit